MTAIAGTVATEYHGTSAQCPLGVFIAIAAVGQVIDGLLARCVHQCHVRTMPSAHTNIAAEQPAAVRTPLKPQVAIAVGILILAVKHRAYLFRGNIHDAQVATVLEVSNFLSVGTELGLKRNGIVVRQPLLAQVGGVCKLFLVLVLNRSTIKLPHTVALGGIDNATPVGGKVNVALLLRGIGNPLRSLIVQRCDIDIAVHHESYLLALGRQAYFRGSGGSYAAYEVAVVTVGSDADVHLL